jgi:hypothetical protein
MIEKRVYNYNKLRGLIRENFGTLRNFADCLGIGTTTLNSRLNSETYFNQAEIEKAARVLNLTKSEVNQVFFTRK